MKHKVIHTENYLLVVDDSEINVKSGNWYIYNQKGIGLRVAQCGTYLPMDAQKIIAHLPLNNSSILEGVDLLPPLLIKCYCGHTTYCDCTPLEQEDDVEKLAEDLFDKGSDNLLHPQYQMRTFFNIGYNKAKEKYKYTEEDMRNAITIAKDSMGVDNDGETCYSHLSTKDIIQSLSQPKIPIGFEREIHDTVFGNINTGELLKWKPKTTINSQGQKVWVGSYLY